ncbi:MAG: transposase [Roseburia sp.]|nr:transposase [Roseburia sp.]
MNRENKVPLWHKYMLTISEASEYFNIGEKKLRQMVQEDSTADFILNNGVKVLIKRVKFEQYIDETCSI